MTEKTEAEYQSSTAGPAIAPVDLFPNRFGSAIATNAT